MQERGQFLDEIALEMALTTDGPMRALRAPMHNARERKRLQPVMTEVSGFKQGKNFKLDYAEIERLPAKMTVAELKEWEVQDAASSVSSSDSLAKGTLGTTIPHLPTDLSREDPRTYTELLDLYSMHEFIIRKGKTLRNTPEFASFKRHYIASWGSIESLIEVLETFLSRYGVELAYVDGKKVATLASFHIGRLITTEDLLDLIANSEDVEPLLDDLAYQYRYGSKGNHRAATKIQSAWRMYRQRIAYMHLLLGTRAATVIQRQWAIHRAHCVTKRTINAVRDTRVARWKQTMINFCTWWPKIRAGRRTVIHIPSLSYPSFHAKKVPFYVARQLGQLTRMADLSDPLIDLVFIAPFKPEPEVLDYYFSLLDDAGVVNANGRFTLLVPEDTKRLPDGMSLTRLVLLSSRLMKILGAISTGKPAYLVPGVVGQEELLLASQLNLPLMSPEPRIAQVFGTKSGCLRLLESADVATPIGATALRSRSDIVRALANLMIQHRSVSRWLVKLETDSGSRGHAYFDCGRMKALKGPNLHPVTLFVEVLKELEDYGGKRVRLVHPGCYPDWGAFLAMADVVGATIEAVPNRVVANITANLFIEPSGEVNLQSVVEPLLAPAYTVMGGCFPCTTPIPYEAVRQAAVSVGRAAYRKRVLGYLSVDFILFESAGSTGEPSSTAGGVRLWGVDVDIQLTNNAAAHHFAAMLTHSTWDPATGTCVSADGHGLHYVYSGIIYNPLISAIRHTPFFSLCKSRGVAYDRIKRSGVVFHLVDVLLRGCLGAISLGSDMTRAVKKISDFQSLLNLELPKQGEHSSESNFVYFSSVVRQLARLLKDPSGKT